MAQSAYQIRLKSKAGAPVAVFTHENLTRLTTKRVVNGVGTHSLTIDATNDDRCDLFAVDGQVEVWRRPPGQDWYLEYEGFHRDGEYGEDDDGKEIFTSTGVGYQDLLGRRAIVEYAGSAGAAKSAPAETVIKAYVTEQIGASAPAADRVTGLTVQADAGSGNSIAITRPYRNLLEVCQEIARVGGGDFDVVGTGAGTWEFRWYDGQRGTDRRSTIVFSTGYGNMRDPKLAKLASRGNVVLVLGQGEGEERTWVWRPASGAPTGIDRRVIVRDARDTNDAATLQGRGDAELDRYRARSELSFSVVQTSAYLYGVHYGLGDLVSAHYRDADYDLKIVGVTLKLGDPDEIALEFEDA